MDDENSVRRDANRDCQICLGAGYHFGWIKGTGDPCKLRCPCVDINRESAAKRNAEARAAQA